LARTLPDGWAALASTGAAARERETLTLLAGALPASYTIYHAVHWTRLAQGFAIFGEADFVIVNRSGDLLIIEQKSGLLQETADGLRKYDGSQHTSVPLQLARTRDGLSGRLRARTGCQDVCVDVLLYCPDFKVRDPGSAGVLPERIVDADLAAELPTLIRAILPEGRDQPASAKVHRFLQNLIALEADVSVLAGQAEILVTRLAGGLAMWARRLTLPSFKLRVTGTAGSGKTQLALAEYRASIESGGHPLYLCFNRPLADHFARIAPPGGTIASFHLWCDQRLRAHGRQWDYTQPDAFDALAAAAAGLPAETAMSHDCIIVDEGQDFLQSWADLVFRVAAPDARLLWLEDPLQNIYERAPVALPGWAGLQAPGNHRSPGHIVDLLNALIAREGNIAPIEAHCPFAGDEVQFLVYDRAEDLLPRVRDALRLCWSAGFKAQDTALLSFHGRERSAVLRVDTLGSASLRTFTGDYDMFGAPIHTEGDLLAESVLRFKGQSAPAVVLCEVDFQQLDRRALRRLFVGLTRARHKLVVVLSREAAAAWLGEEHAGDRPVPVSAPPAG
jgi:hypothetical protein